MKKELEQLLSDVDQLILEKENKNQELSKVLRKILNAFNCDRAWCLYPCDPESDTWGVPIEVTRQGWGGIYKLGLQMPTLEVEADIFKDHLNAKGPVTYGKDADYPMPEHAEEVFMIKSQISTVIYPKQGKPWILGIHFCEDHHPFSNDEIESFDILGKKIGEVFDSLIFT